MKKGKKWLRDELMRFKESTSGRYEDVIGVSHVLRVIDQLDEPKKVVISQFVADFIKECKDDGISLYGAINRMSSKVRDSAGENLIEGTFSWQDTFATIWLNYPNIEVEKEPLYYAKVKISELSNWSNDEEDYFSILSDESSSELFLMERWNASALTKTRWAELNVDDTIAIFEKDEEQ